MQKQQFQIGFIALAFVFILVMMGRAFWPAPVEVLPPVDTVVAQIEGEAPVENKAAAARQLMRHGNAAREEVHTLLSSHAKREPEVVSSLLKATGENRDYRSLPTIVELLSHPDPYVRGQAGVAACKILGADYGFRANAPPAERARVIALIKEDIALSQSRIIEFYEGQNR